MIAGMSIGSWILVAVIVVWAAIAIKVYFLGDFKKGKKGLSAGGCCGTGDAECSSRKCTGCPGCNATKCNAVLPEFKIEPK